jgi:stage II sporulation protein M
MDIPEKDAKCPHCGEVVKPVKEVVGRSWLRGWNCVVADILLFWEESRKPLLVMAGIMVGAGVLGLMIGAGMGREEQARVLQDIAGAMTGGYVPGFFGILFNNLGVALMLLGAGLWLRALPGIIIGINGLVIGLVLALAMGTTEIGFFTVLLMIVPHGIFELPAIVGAAALGMRVNSWKQKEEGLKKHDVRRVARFFFYIVALLVVAAAIEALMIAIAT